MEHGWLITFRSITFAQKGQQVLRSEGIFSTLQRTPKNLSERGCSYCLGLRCEDGGEAVAVLKARQVFYNKVFALTPDGPREQKV